MTTQNNNVIKLTLAWESFGSAKIPKQSNKDKRGAKQSFTGVSKEPQLVESSTADCSFTLSDNWFYYCTYRLDHQYQGLLWCCFLSLKIAENLHCINAKLWSFKCLLHHIKLVV